MENPFVKLVKEGEEPSMEEETPVDTIFEVRDDGVYVKDIFEGNREGKDWVRIHDNPNDSEGAERAHRSYRRERGILEESQ